MRVRPGDSASLMCELYRHKQHERSGDAAAGSVLFMATQFDASMHAAPRAEASLAAAFSDKMAPN